MVREVPSEEVMFELGRVSQDLGGNVPGENLYEEILQHYFCTK